MKHLLFLLLLLLSAAGYGQRLEIDLTPVNSKIDALEKRVKALEKGGIIVSKPDCERGPTVGRITDISTKGITVEWDGKDVFHLKYTVSSMGKMYVDSVKPDGNKIKITFPAAFPNGTYTVTFEGLNCAGVSSGQFTIAGGVDPPSAKDCQGKEISFKVNGHNSQSATIQFDAEGLTDLLLSLVQEDKTQARNERIIASKPYHPDVNTLYFPYGKAQPSGKYRIKLTPVSCNAPAIYQDIIINSETGTIDLPIDTTTYIPGEYKYSVVAKGMDSHLKLSKVKSGNAILLSDKAGLNPADGYEWFYMVGGEVLRQSTELSNYIFQGHNPLSVLKMQVKKGLNNPLNRWSNKVEEGTYYDVNAGQPLAGNVTAGLETGVFQGDQDPNGFLNIIPKNYNAASQLPQWADISPDLKLPKGRFFHLSRGTWPIEQVLKKGVTHISHYQIPRPNGDESYAVELKRQGITYNDVPVTRQIFQLGDTGVDDFQPEGYNKRYWTNGPLSEAEAIKAAQRHSIPDALWIGETTEGAEYMPMGMPMWRPFYKQLKKQYKEAFDSRGIPWEICHTYLYINPTNYTLGYGNSREKYKEFARASPENMPKSEFTPGGTLTETTLIVDPVYISPPDEQANVFMRSVYRMTMWSLQGYHTGIFLTGVYDWKPNNYVEFKFPEGTYYHRDKIPLDPNIAAAYAFISQDFGNTFVDWGDAGPPKKGKKFDPNPIEKGVWFPNNANGPSNGFPHTATDNDYWGYNGAPDFSRFGLQLWVETFGKLEGGTKKYLDYRLDGGEWVTAVNEGADVVVDCYYDKKGFARSVFKDGQIAWYYVNPFADNKYHDLEVRFPNGRIARQKVAGIGIHAKIESL